jgi:tyrosyl-tRNA synthetase
MPLKSEQINPSTEFRINKILTRGVAEVIDKEHLEKRLKAGDKLRVKLGIDPTAPDLHLGHAVVLRKLKQFQDAGHKAVFIVGDFTATIGDPSGRSELRPKLSASEIKENMKNYVKEAGKILDMKKADVVYNSQWYKNKGASFLMELTSKFTVARSLERDDFQKRLKENRDISILELYYPILQGYDSVEVRADVELGGTDQKFNLLMGRRVQKRYGLPEQDIMTLTLLEGTDGARKMSKSLGNYIGLSEDPGKMFAKIMSIPDDLMVKYFTLLTDVAESEIDELRQGLLTPSAAKRLPKEWKEMLSCEIVRTYCGENAAKDAQAEFDRVFGAHEAPSEIPEVAISDKNMNIADLLVKTRLAPSKSEARRLVEQGGVRIGGEVKGDAKEEIAIKEGMVVQVGRRRFARLSLR